MIEILIAVGLVALVFSALWALSRRANRGCYPATKSLHMPGPSMDAPAGRYEQELRDLRESVRSARLAAAAQSPGVWHLETRPVQKKLDAALKKALRSMSDADLRAFSPEPGDEEARRMRKLEMDRRSRKARRHARAARKAFESIQNGCKDSILRKAERDSLMPQGWDANGSPT